MRIFGLPAPLVALFMSCASGIAAPRNSTLEEEHNTQIKASHDNKPPVPPNPPPLPPPRPLVIWHGLGDQYASAGMLEFIELIKEMHEGIFIYSARISDEPNADQKAGWFGNVNEQVAQVAEQIAAIPELEGGFDAIGFSQGGQFLRAYVERFNSPPVRNLITFGSQHMGISDLPGCKPTDWLCRAARAAAASGVYSPWAQKNLVQAQYFRDHRHIGSYLHSSTFLADINNEIPEEDDDEDEEPRIRNLTYAFNLASLDNFVMALFDQDQTVVPKESAWFGSYALPTDDDNDVDKGAIIPMRKQRLYKEDWIGLRTLDEADKLFLIVCQGEHMRLTDECWRPIVARWVGSIDMDKVTEASVPQIPSLLIQDW
ncbi:related to palmitoyl-protein thioesterase 1 [Serendipita indica DSM 11827]|uniref:Palmitoyl-protein thioesterase 1 n=1 Tax=Serendipita indica (strain DSM 11827) TaxID=1109443 RepID=G4T9E9_SERID|nr:related to palmitoyl-protein thioesterase 1 [Serendipita indica DSM 11827]